MVGGATGGRGVDRGDRAGGRSRPVDRVLLGAQARPHVVARAAPRRTRRHRPRTARRDRRLRAVGPRHGRRLRTKPDDRPPLAAPPRPGDTANGARSTGQSRPRGGSGTSRAAVPATRHDSPRAPQGRLSLRSMSGRARRGQAPPHQAATRARSRWTVRVVRLRPLPRGVCSSTMSTEPRSDSRSARRGCRARWPRRARRRRNACSCAPTATLRSRAGSLELPLRSVDVRVYPA